MPGTNLPYRRLRPMRFYYDLRRGLLAATSLATLQVALPAYAQQYPAYPQTAQPYAQAAGQNPGSPTSRRRHPTGGPTVQRRRSANGTASRPASEPAIRCHDATSCRPIQRGDAVRRLASGRPAERPCLRRLPDDAGAAVSAAAGPTRRSTDRSGDERLPTGLSERRGSGCSRRSAISCSTTTAVPSSATARLHRSCDADPGP